MSNLEHLIENGLCRLNEGKSYNEWREIMQQDCNWDGNENITLDNLWEICQYVIFTWMQSDDMDEPKEEAPSVDQVIIQGWQCPICKRIYSPYTEKCSYCESEQESNVVLNVISSSDFNNKYNLRGRNWEESEYGRWRTD